MRRALWRGTAFVALLLAATTGSSCTTEPAREPRGGTTANAPPARPVELAALPDLPPIRFDAGSKQSAVMVVGVEVESVVVDPLAAVTLRIALKNAGALAVTGVVHVALPGSTITAQSEDGVALSPSMAPADHGDLAFQTAPTSLDPGAEKTIVVRFAAALVGPSRSVGLRLAALGPLTKGPLADLTFRSDNPAPEGLTVANQTFSRVASTVKPARPIRSAVVLLDTSARRSRDLAAQWSFVRDLAKKLAPDTPLIVAAYDEAPVELYRGTAGYLPSSLASTFASRGALGRANVDQALAWAVAQGGPATDRIVIVSDALQAERRANVSAWIAPWKVAASGLNTRIDVVVPSGARSQAGIEVLASAAPRGGRVVGLYEDALALVDADDSEGWNVPSAAAWPTNASAAVGEIVTKTQASSPSNDAGLPAWVAQAPAATTNRAALSALEIATSARPFRNPDGSVDDPLASANSEPHAPRRQSPHTRDPLSSELDESAYNKRVETGALTNKPEAQPIVDKPAVEKPKPDVPEVRGTLPPDAIQGIVRRNFGRFRACYQEVLRKIPSSAGRVVVEFTIHPTGIVSLARSLSSDITDSRFVSCVVTAFEALSFPPSDRDPITVKYPFTLAKTDGEAPPPPITTTVPWKGMAKTAPLAEAPKEPWRGTTKLVYEAIARGDTEVALEAAERLVSERPEDALGYLLLTDALAAAGEGDRAMRAASSLVDLAPADVGATLLAAGRLRAIKTAESEAAAQNILQATLLRNENPATVLQALAVGYARQGAFRTSLQLLDVGLGSTKVSGSVALRDALRADLAIYGAAAVRADPSLRLSYSLWLADVGVVVADPGAFRASISWSGEATDVDLMVQDIGLSRTTRITPALPTGGRHLGDVASGPAIEAFYYDRSLGGRAYPYVMTARLRSSTHRFDAGVVEIAELNDRGLFFSSKPFVVEVAGADVEVMRLEQAHP